MPPWLDRCLQSVRDWAALRGYEYRFLGDEFLDAVPDWYRQKCGAQVLPVTDLARLVHAARFLAEGWGHVIWLDADILVFEPARFDVDRPGGFTFCLEIGLGRTPEGRIVTRRSVNNSVASFRGGSAFLPFLIEACQMIVGQKKGAIEALDVGPPILTALRRLIPFGLITDVALVEPRLLDDLVQGTDGFLNIHAAASPGPFHAAHLCRSFSQPGLRSVVRPEAAYDTAVDRLLTAGGAALGVPGGIASEEDQLPR